MGKWTHGDEGGEDDRGLTDEGRDQTMPNTGGPIMDLIFTMEDPWEVTEQPAFHRWGKRRVQRMLRVPGKWVVEPGSSGGLPEEPRWGLPSSTDFCGSQLPDQELLLDLPHVSPGLISHFPLPFSPSHLLLLSTSQDFVFIPVSVLPVLIKQDLPRSSPIALISANKRIV